MDVAMTSTTRTVCPACGEPVSGTDLYCENCGAELQSSAPATPALDTDTEPTIELHTGDPGAAAAVVPGPCRSCGGTVSADGYCETCGTKATKLRDHFTEQPAPWVAAVCDRGIRHSRNEDAVAIAADPEPGSRALLVVCDGVSSSLDSDVASLAAARAARDVLVAGQAQGMGTEASREAAVIARLNAAADAASDAVLANTSPDSPNPASCTFVATVLEAGLLVAGVVGDSRAYWFPDNAEAVALTVDDSWAAELIATGVPRHEAETGPQGHAITRWLGKDAPDHTPRTTTLRVAGPGWLMACSDGLWNYCSEAAPLADLVRQTAAANGGEPLATASALVDWANAQGGQDNITVALARL
ncbi:serine/threonine protein phosphatase [Kribbella sp. ALI-6-A]|nr:serine/threonine protein phosphatase [Kribbella sp. ALI-6-A]